MSDPGTELSKARNLSGDEIRAVRLRIVADQQRPARAGIVRVLQANDDHQPTETDIYLIPGTSYGVPASHVSSLPHSRQADVMEAWVKANFEPGPPEVQIIVGGQIWFNIEEEIDTHFGGPWLTDHGPAVQETMQRLQQQSIFPVWTRRAEDPEALKREALARLDLFEVAFRKLTGPPRGIGDNGPPEPIEELPFSSEDARQAVESAIADTRIELRAAHFDAERLRTNCAAILGVSLAAIRWLGRAGEPAATEFLKAFGKTMGVAAGAGMALYYHEALKEVGHSALHLAEMLQRLCGF